MKRTLFSLILALLGVSTIARADVFEATYGVAKVFPFWLYNADGTFDVDEADGGTEVALSCNQGAETTATNDFVDEGSHYSISLTAAELQCQTVVVVVNATVVGGFIIQTEGHASAFKTITEANAVTVGPTGAATAQTARDIGASVLLSNGTGTGQIVLNSGRVNADAVALSGDTSAADELEAWLDGTTGARPYAGIKHQGTAQAYTHATPSLTLDASATFGTNTLRNNIAFIYGSTQGYWQEARIASSSGDIATLEAPLEVEATGTITYKILMTQDSEDTGCAGLTENECIAFKTFAGIEADSATPVTPTDGALKDVYDIVSATSTTIGTAGVGLTEAGGTGDQLTALATQASVNDLPTNAELATALADGVAVISYINAAGDVCTFTISEDAPNLTPVCVEAP